MVDSMMRLLTVLLAALLLTFASTSSAADAMPASTGTFWSGAVLTALGGLGVVGGASTYLIFGAQHGEVCDAMGCVDSYKPAKTAGLVGLMVGGAALAVGVPLLLSSRKAPGQRESRLTVGPGRVALSVSF